MVCGERQRKQDRHLLTAYARRPHRAPQLRRPWDGNRRRDSLRNAVMRSAESGCVRPREVTVIATWLMLEAECGESRRFSGGAAGQLWLAAVDSGDASCCTR